MAETGSVEVNDGKARELPPALPPLPPRYGPLLRHDKYWLYIPSFEGPWSNFRSEDLELLARINYSRPRPHVIDPGVFFDIARIKGLLRDSLELIMLTRKDTRIKLKSMKVTGIGKRPDLSNTYDSTPDQATVFGYELLAMEKLYKAWTLDDTAACVASTHMINFLQLIVPIHILKHSDDIPAGYVSFFCDRMATQGRSKIVNTRRLDRLLGSDFDNPSVLRSRALTSAFNHDWAEAKNHFDKALSVVEEATKFQRRVSHEHEAGTNIRGSHEHEARMNMRDPSGPQARSRDSVLRMTDSSKPTGLEMQLHFQRGMVHLEWACEYAALVLEPGNGSVNSDEDEDADAEPDENSERQIVQEAFDAVNSNAEAALKDILFFLSKLNYSPGHKKPPACQDTIDLQRRANSHRRTGTIPRPRNNTNRRRRDTENLRREAPLNSRRQAITFLQGGNLDPHRPVGDAASSSGSNCAQTEFNGEVRTTSDQTARATSDGTAKTTPHTPTHRVCEISGLFGAVPPSDLPKFPSPRPLVSELRRRKKSLIVRFGMPDATERVTYHPHLHEALHALLLCHVLLQTDAKLLRRYAMMVARLISLSDRAGIFSTSFYTKSEVDWLHILTATMNWIKLPRPWHYLCQRKARFRPRGSRWDRERAEILAQWIFIVQETNTSEELESDATTAVDDDLDEIDKESSSS